MVYYKLFLPIYKQTVKNVTATTTSIGGLYGMTICNNKNKYELNTVSKCMGIGAICGLAYPISISLYSYCIVDKFIKNPYSPSTDIPIL